MKHGFLLRKKRTNPPAAAGRYRVFLRSGAHRQRNRADRTVFSGKNRFSRKRVPQTARQAFTETIPRLRLGFFLTDALRPLCRLHRVCSCLFISKACLFDIRQHRMIWQARLPQKILNRTGGKRTEILSEFPAPATKFRRKFSAKHRSSNHTALPRAFCILIEVIL